MPPATGLKRFSWTPLALSIRLPDDKFAEIPSFWLRDNCPADRDSQNGQRLIDITDLPAAPRIRSVLGRDEHVLIEWENESRTDKFHLGWLIEHAVGDPSEGLDAARELWLEGGRRNASQDFAFLPFAKFRDVPEARLRWLSQLIQQGVAFLTGVPCTDRALLEPIKRIGVIQETNYGRVFDVRFLPKPENLADSDRGLGLHTDNPYRDPVPGFQALHFLAASPEGGKTILADGFAIADHLRLIRPELFSILSQTPVPFSFQSSDLSLHAERPLLQLSLNGTLQAVHYNNRSIAPLPPARKGLARFYEAYRFFAELLREAAFQLKIQMHDGDMVVFDNHRILHGRTAFSSVKYPRHLQGCYLTRDSVLSNVVRL